MNKIKYDKQQRLNIGKEIYEKKINQFDASIKYNINEYTARNYLRQYKAYLRQKKLKQYKIIYTTNNNSIIQYVVYANDNIDAESIALMKLNEDYNFYIEPIKTEVYEID